MSNPFIINMKYAFQDIENLYIALDYLSGGDLRYHLFTKPSFSESECSSFGLTQSSSWLV